MSSSKYVTALAVLSASMLHAGCDSASSSSGGSTPDTTRDAGLGPTGDSGAHPGMVLAPCAASTGPGTVHDKEITADETWTAKGSPHRVPYHLRLLATVTIEPCAAVIVDEGYTITLGMAGRAGALVARGERGVDSTGAPLRRPVTFSAADPSKPWGSLSVSADGRLDLETAILSDAANATSDQNGGGAIVAYGNTVSAGAVVKNVRAVDVTVEKSHGYGANFTSLSGFTDDSKDISFTGGGRDAAPFPVRIEVGALATVPTLTATGNKADEVQIVASAVAMLDDTIRARGVPYHVSGRIRVAPATDGAPVKLTIEPGVTLRFSDDLTDSGLQLGTSDTRQGILVAEGTATQPITFTSAKAPPAPGDWKNVYFSNSPSTGNRIANAVFEYAGAPSGAQGYGCGPIENDATILILSARPTDAFIQNTTLRKGAGDTGILLGWTSDLAGPDFTSTNTFVEMPACRVSRWRNETGVACPNGTPECF